MINSTGGVSRAFYHEASRQSSFRVVILTGAGSEQRPRVARPWLIHSDAAGFFMPFGREEGLSMFDKLFDLLGLNRGRNRARNGVRRLLDRPGTRSRSPRRHHRNGVWDDDYLHLPAAQLGPVVVRPRPAHRYRR